MPETRLGDLRDADQVTGRAVGGARQAVRGRVREIAPNADPATRTFAAKITIRAARRAVKLGMTANVALGDRAGGEVITLPLTALTQVDGKPAVWVVDPQTSQVNLRPVAIGAYREDGVTVRDGLRTGEVVVTAGVHKLPARRDGA